MLFAHDTEHALAGAAALVNTDQPDGDLLADVAALDSFVQEWGWTGQLRHDQAELDAVRRLRPRLRQLWFLDEPAAAELVNTLLRQTNALPQLVRHDAWDYHLHATPPDAPLADRMAVEAAMAMIDVIRQKELPRLQLCAAADCGDVLVDLSKNRSRRFCSTSCSNRTNVAAFRARKANE
ncbi:predicted RNA-binding Zn ribbon-like protein [Jatrophihabitans sp. GAS493]|uniref:CGNR zinc finger domain-containing protein n=1 Tax=Jatrophihabitans sp. GAS493 TaxID=1907575 RepID=UPI000BB695AA|nr:CGNR zinc finger domain-containing protein [Jatrophihabitans sp. GAS493]SOD72048.1 predicted RNA-binding Zn ribbon-like protein [Jatrophihabitans sp. GAS493]